MIPSKSMPNMQRSENKSYLVATRGERGSSQLTLEYLHSNSALIGNEAFHRRERGKILVHDSFQPNKDI